MASLAGGMAGWRQDGDEGEDSSRALKRPAHEAAKRVFCAKVEHNHPIRFPTGAIKGWRLAKMTPPTPESQAARRTPNGEGRAV